MEREKIIDLSDEKLEELQKKVMEAWDYLHDIVGKVGMPGGDMIFFDNPIKTPSLEVPGYIFSGKPGTGRTTIAKALCEELGFEYEVIDATNTVVEVSQSFWSRPNRSYNPQPRQIQVGDRVRLKGEIQIMEVTFVGQGIAICKWFDMHGYEMADTFDLGDLEFANSQVSTLDDHDCVESKKKGWCGEYCEQARKGKCPEGVKAKFPHEEKEEAEKEEIKDFEYDGTWTTL